MADSCNVLIFGDKQMALVTEMENAVAEMKVQKFMWTLPNTVDPSQCDKQAYMQTQVTN